MKNKTCIVNDSYNRPVRVLYKQTGKPPVVRIVNNVWRLKRLIIKDILKMIRYENYIILCFKSKQNIGVVPNIVMDFKNIAGDFFFIAFNPKTKNFRSLTLREIEFYVDELSRKSFNMYQYKKFLEKNIAKEKRKNKTITKNLKSNVQVEEDKITIKPVESYDNKPLAPEVVEFQKQIYEHICTKFGLDPTKGKIVFEKSKDDNFTDEVQIDWNKNTITLSPDNFEKYKKANEKNNESSKDEIDNNIKLVKVESNKPSKKESLELILKIQSDILNYVKNAVDNDEDHDD